MKNQYYSVHQNFTDFFDPQSKNFLSFKKVNLKESIDEHLKLLFMTNEGEFRYDHEYGTLVGELDFTNEKQSGYYEKMVEHSLLQAITRYESRLKAVEVDVKFNKTGVHFITPESNSFRLTIKVSVEAKYVFTNEEYKNEFEIFFSPLSE